MFVRRLRALIGLCQHEAMRRERRKLLGVPDILFLVCDDCGYAKAAIERTAEEYAAIKAKGSVKVLKATRRDWLLQWRKTR